MSTCHWEPEKKQSNAVNHPAHYTGITINGHPVECIDVIEALQLPYHLGNVLKYLWRHRKKNGLEDLRKAEWYLRRYADQQENLRA